ncbi:MAG TPA: hypothetical protein VF701_02025 [Thermoanaerobaculia bacterium]
MLEQACHRFKAILPAKYGIRLTSTVRLGPVIIATLVFAASATSAGADWLISGGFGHPMGISTLGDRVLVFAHDSALEFASDGTLRSANEYEAAEGRVQIERVVPAADGLVATGVFIAEDGSSRHPMVARLEANGDVQWARAIDASWITGMTLAVEAADLDIVVLTRAGDGMLLVRFSPAGEARWGRLVDRTDREVIRGLTATSDGGVLALTGALGRFGALTRIDARGTVVWDVLLGNADAGFGLFGAVELPDGGFLAVGRMRTTATQDRDGWLVRVSATGELRWQKALGGTSEDALYAITAVGKEGFAAIGTTASAGAGDSDTWLVRVDADGNVKSEMTAGRAGVDEGPLGEMASPLLATEDGDLLFATRSGAGLLAGRIRSASSTCSATRAIRSRERVSLAVAGRGSLTRRDTTPVTRAVVLSRSKGASKWEDLCRWTPNDAAAKTEVIATGSPDEAALFADQVARLLRDRRFVQLDATAAHAREKRSRLASGHSKLMALYKAAGRHASLHALGEEDHRKLLEEWRSATGSPTSRIALASYYSTWAQLIRGVGFYDTLLDADAERHAALTNSAMELLVSADSEGVCDTACYHLQILTAHLGGWSKPLQKLHAIDPGYWEVFEPASYYLTENWGGRPGEYDRFVDSYAAATRDTVGDAIYAMRHASWQFGVLHVAGAAPRPAPDWQRMKKGFEDFLRLYPKSSWIAHRYAAAAYRVERDRQTARFLFGTPLLEFGTSDGAWQNRNEFEAAKSWATRKPVETFAARFIAGKAGPWEKDLPRVVAPVRVDFDDGTVETMNAFLVSTATGPLLATGLSRETANVPHRRPVGWLFDRDVTVLAEKVQWPLPLVQVVDPAPEDLVARLHQLKPRSTPAVIGERFYIVACSGSGDRCDPKIATVRVRNAGTSYEVVADGGPIDWREVPGAPAFDDDGAVAGVLIPDPIAGTANVVPLPLVRESSSSRH